MSAYEKVAGHLRNFKSTGPSTGIASCPTAAHKHGDRSRGLSVRVGDGCALIYCHAGCGAAEVMGALGLTLGDLYDTPLPGAVGGINRPTHSRIPYRDLLEIIDLEALTVGMIALEFKNTKHLSDEDWMRLATATARIGRARDHAHGR